MIDQYWRQTVSAAVNRAAEQRTTGNRRTGLPPVTKTSTVIDDCVSRRCSRNNQLTCTSGAGYSRMLQWLPELKLNVFTIEQSLTAAMVIASDNIVTVIGWHQKHRVTTIQRGGTQTAV